MRRSHALHFPRSHSVGGDPPPATDYVAQFIDFNADNDNGSIIVDYIPEVRDYQVGSTPMENDVLPLTLEAIPAGNHDYYVPQRVEWFLSVAYSGEGRLRFWDSASKETELFPSDSWQFTPAPQPWPIEGTCPTVHIEGINMSSDLRDITITYQTRIFTTQGPVLVTNYKPVQVTVTPVVKDMWFDKLVKPQFLSRINGELVPQPTSKADFGWGEARIRADYVAPMIRERVDFIQFLTNTTNDLQGNISIIELGGIRWRDVLLTQQQQLARGHQGPNFAFPLLDTFPQDVPWYKPSPIQLINLAERVERVEMVDYPGIDPLANIVEYGTSDYFSTYLAWMHLEARTGAKVLTSLARLEWEMHFRFGGWTGQPLDAMTTNTSTAHGDIIFTKVGPNGMPPAVPNVVDQAVETIRAD